VKCHCPTVRYLIVIIAFAVRTVSGQPEASSQETTASSSSQGPLDGIRITNASFYGTYYSSLAMVGGPSGYDVSAGGSATLRWSRMRSRSSISWNYTAAYTRDITYSAINALNHDFSLTYGYKIHPNWSLVGGVTAEVVNTYQFVFEPNSLSQALQVAGTPDELAATVLSNTSYDNTRLTALLTGVPSVNSPASRLFFGDRTLNAAFRTGVAYRKARLSILFEGEGTRIQHLSEGSTGQPATTSYLLGDSNTGQVGMNLSYSLSPRTQIGASVASQRTFSQFEDVYTTTTTATFGRRMSERWFMEMHGGLGFFRPVRSSFQLPTGPQYIMGGNAGFKTSGHALLVSVDRSIANSYGYGGSSNLSTTAAWNWGRRNGGWRIQASESWQQIQIADLPDVNAWLTTVGFTEPLAGRKAITFTYTYMRTTNAYTSMLNNQAIQGLRIAFVWAPMTIAN